ncbi:MAG: type II toxin-antitoxin system prevent-host-death family antitoxin [Chloroflexaceae bacterium]|nr:type II toxin-antitoxin system prevent-host-death family antitoxin [Chloroflexaceae bacterium]
MKNIYDHSAENSDPWTIQEAKAKLSEVLRLAREEGPQTIGIDNPCVVISLEQWQEQQFQQLPLGRWLVAKTPRIDGLQLPERQDPPMENPFEEELA